MKKVLAVEPVAPMSAVNVELDIIAEEGEKILSQNWRGEFIQLTPSMVKDNKTIYRIEDSNIDISKLKFGWMKGEDQCHLVSSSKTKENTKRKKKKKGVDATK